MAPQSSDPNAPQPSDSSSDFVNNGGLAATVILGVFVLCSGSWFGYHLVRKLQAYRQKQREEAQKEQEKLKLVSDDASIFSEMSYVVGSVELDVPTTTQPDKIRHDQVKRDNTSRQLPFTLTIPPPASKVKKTSNIQSTDRQGAPRTPSTSASLLKVPVISPPQTPLSGSKDSGAYVRSSPYLVSTAMVSEVHMAQRSYMPYSPHAKSAQTTQASQSTSSPKNAAGNIYSSPPKAAPCLREQGRTHISQQLLKPSSEPSLPTVPRSHSAPPQHTSSASKPHHRVISNPLQKGLVPGTNRPAPLALHHHVSWFAPRPKSPLTGRKLSPQSSAMLLMTNPALAGKRAGDISPGLDPDYEYPMTPGQIGDGRPLYGLGRADGGHQRSWSAELP